MPNNLKINTKISATEGEVNQEALSDEVRYVPYIDKKKESFTLSPTEKRKIIDNDINYLFCTAPFPFTLTIRSKGHLEIKNAVELHFNNNEKIEFNYIDTDPTTPGDNRITLITAR